MIRDRVVGHAFRPFKKSFQSTKRDNQIIHSDHHLYLSRSFSAEHFVQFASSETDIDTGTALPGFWKLLYEYSHVSHQVLWIHVETVAQRITPHNHIAILVDTIDIERMILEVDASADSDAFSRPGQDSFVDVVVRHE